MAAATVLMAPHDPPPVRSIDVERSPGADREAASSRDRARVPSGGREGRKERPDRGERRKSPPVYTLTRAPARQEAPAPAALPSPPSPTGAFVPAAGGDAESSAGPGAAHADDGDAGVDEDGDDDDGGDDD
jgi:hypothetical protein